jgi:hypothetical protein
MPLIRRVSGDFEANDADIDPIEVTFTGWPPEGANVDELGVPGGKDAGDAPAADASDAATGGNAASVMADRMRNLPPPNHSAYEHVTTRDRLDAWSKMIRQAGLVTAGIVTGNSV